MGNRFGLFASVVLASAALAATSSVAAPAADECIAKPNGPAPAGQHWYYRTNRELKKKCWYLADEGEKTVPVDKTASAEKTPPAAEKAAPVARAKRQPITDALVEQPDDSSVQPSTSDARAELIDGPKFQQPVATIPQRQLQQPQLVQPQLVQPQLAQPQVMQPQPAQPQAEAAPAASESATPRNWTMASRWPDANAASAESAPMPSTPASAPAPAPRTESSAAPVVLAAAAVEPAEQGTVGISNPSNYGFVFAGAILAVIAGGAIVMFLGRRKQALVPFEENMRHVRPRLDTSSFARPIAPEPMPSQSMLRDEIEELLEMSRRQPRAL
jgi:hypothetical protein